MGMAKFPTIEEFAKSVAEKALDEYVCDGKTLRQWVLMILNGEFVPVVRCKDCKYYYARLSMCEHERWMDVDGWNKDVEPTNFCSYGERRTEK